MSIQKFKCKSCTGEVIYDPEEGKIVIPFLRNTAGSFSITKAEMEKRNIETVTLRKIYLKCDGNPQHEHAYYFNELS
jgi:hypothetical protein